MGEEGVEIGRRQHRLTAKSGNQVTFVMNVQAADAGARCRPI